MKHDSFNESTEMYLKTIGELATDDEPVSIAAIAQRLGVSAVSATEMIKRLQERDLLAHIPYKGVHLTAKGWGKANALIRTHLLWECFLVDKLQLPWEQAHDFACRLEHATDTAVTEALALFLDYPVRCPHGNPIPDGSGNLASDADVSLADMLPGQSGTIARISPESTLVLEYLAARHLTPGTAVAVEEIAPFNGPIMVVSDDMTHPLGQEVAAYIFVTVDENSSFIPHPS
jgi:DtxR family Mn-dependent transcriptional regulator